MFSVQMSINSLYLPASSDFSTCAWNARQHSIFLIMTRCQEVRLHGYQDRLVPTSLWELSNGSRPSKNAYLEFQILGADHPKYADSLYELSRVHIELNETNEAKKLLTQMLKDYPNRLLFNKASTLIQSL